MFWLIAIIIVIAAVIIIKFIINTKYEELQATILKELGFKNWNIIPYCDEFITVKSRQSLEKYDEVKFFKENKEKLVIAEKIILQKNNRAKILKDFLADNEFKSCFQYNLIAKKIEEIIKNKGAYRISVTYISSAGNNLGEKIIFINKSTIEKFKNDPSLLMSKSEYNKFIKEQQKEDLEEKQHKYYDKVNNIITYANETKNILIIKGSKECLDDLIAQLFDRTINSIKRIKSLDSEEWDVIKNFIVHIKNEIDKITFMNQKIIDYYKSSDFQKIKDTCKVLMDSQREFNEYINEKVESISQLFGSRVVRNETVNDDEYSYIRPYQKEITPFTAEVSAAVFASAENNPLEYVVKYFYPYKKEYPKQIQKLYLLVEELETLKDAKQIIENYKADYQTYLGDVPNYIMEFDEAGFYSRLGFANIDESVFHIEYKFIYTSGGGMAQRSFTVPMTEETIAELIKMLENKLTESAFVKEQRNLMTQKLRQSIKNRDNFTCCNCGNSIYKEPNLLLEIDHIIPVSKGGCTVENNLQTLCWKCNRAKSNKIAETIKQ